MRYLKLPLCLLISFIGIYAAAQKDTAEVNRLIREAKIHIAGAPDMAISLATTAYETAVDIRFDSGAAQGLKLIGNVYYFKRDYTVALDYWSKAREVFEKINDVAGVSNIYNNIGAIYFDQGDDLKALEYYQKSLTFAEKSGDKVRIATVLNNIGGIFFNKKATYDKAKEYFTRALSIANISGDADAMGTAASNLGEVYAALNEDDKALSLYRQSLGATTSPEVNLYTYNLLGKLYAKRKNFVAALSYHNKAYQLAEKFDQLYTVQSLIGIGSVYEKMGNHRAALSSYLKGEKIAREIEADKELEHIYGGLASSYQKLNDYSNAFNYLSKYSDVTRRLYNVQTDNKLALKDYDYNLKSKQDEINLLGLKAKNQEQVLEKQKQAKIALLVGLGLILAIAVILYRNYRSKVKTNRVLDRQKAEIQALLGNILPDEVAKELQQTGVATPRHYENVSVMFTDFRGFTSIADKLTPELLVQELGSCFMAFDNIIDKYNLEKIKTIGDSYMCAGGVPVPDKNHVHNIIRASMEIQQYLSVENEKRRSQGRDTWELRIGINVGPVVAGVVGKKKYAYDIWGSTVNIASRMESNGVAGRVNISESTYHMVKDKFNCSYRGKINAKNIGDIDMYFVDSEKDGSDTEAMHEVMNTGTAALSSLEEVAS